MSRNINELVDAPIALSNGAAFPGFHKSDYDKKLHFVSIDAATRYRLEGSDDGTNWFTIVSGLSSAAPEVVISQAWMFYRLVCTTISGGPATTARYLARSGGH